MANFLLRPAQIAGKKPDLNEDTFEFDTQSPHTNDRMVLSVTLLSMPVDKMVSTIKMNVHSI